MSPSSDLTSEKEVADLVRGMVQSGLADTVHDISGGGEIVALSEMALAGGLGVTYGGVEIEPLITARGRADVALFGENGASFLVAVPESHWNDLQRALGEVPYDSIARVGGDSLRIGELIDVKLEELREAYERDLFS